MPVLVVSKLVLEESKLVPEENKELVLQHNQRRHDLYHKNALHGHHRHLPTLP